ncbi:MAG: SDR family oxidoreductase [Nitrospinota bacterium]|nr:SDR family oxidoreductase [Nitrospinota bacterium]
MELNLENRKVVITGASEGIGRSLTLAFASAGAKVAGCARNKARLEAVEKEMDGNGHLFISGDLTESGDLKNFFEKIQETFGGIDVLINNAGSIVKLANFLEVTDKDWQDSFNINLMTAVRLSRLLIPSLKRSPSPRIINISSIAAIRPGEIFPHYSAMKAGLSNLTVSLSQLLAPDKILVNSVSPGPVWSRSWENEARETAEKSSLEFQEVAEEIKTSTAQTIPLKRMGVPEDITGLVLFLASDLARWITGTNFTVDGGIVQDPY